MTPQSTPLFVYGSFAHGGPGHALVQDALFLGRGVARAVAYKLAEGAQRLGLQVRGGGDAIVGGELLRADEALLARVDAAHGEHFQRRIVQVRAGSMGPRIDAWVHVYTGPWANVPLAPAGILDDGSAMPGPTAWYFGYASNMFHMAERRKLNVLGPHLLGRVDGWRIAFAKDSGNGEHNYATLLPKRGGVVKGALYRMKQTELEGQLDPQEKEGWHLVRRTYPIVLEGGEHAGETVWGEAYVCLPRWWFWNRISHPVNTEKIVPGARLVGLDAEYVAWLEQFCNTPSNPESYDLDLLDFMED